MPTLPLLTLLSTPQRKAGRQKPTPSHHLWVWGLLASFFLCLTETVSCYVAHAGLEHAARPSVSLPGRESSCAPHTWPDCLFSGAVFIRSQGLSNTDWFNQATLCSKYIKHRSKLVKKERPHFAMNVRVILTLGITPEFTGECA